MMTADIQELRKKPGEWALATAVIILAVFVTTASFGVGHFVDRDLADVSAYTGDPAWVPYQIAIEHDRLHLAAEDGADAQRLRTIGEVFLSYVDRLRKSPPMKAADTHLQQQMTAMDASARAIERLLAGIDTSEGREALLKRLEQDAPFVAGLALDVSKLYRRQSEAERLRREDTLRFYVRVLQILHAALFCLALIAIVLGWKLIALGRDRARQHAMQSSILKAVEEGILGISSEGKVLYYNARADAFLGHAIVPGCPLPLPNPGDSDLLAQVQSLIEEDGEVRSVGAGYTRTIQTGLGDAIRHFTLNMTPCRDCDKAGGEGNSYVITIRDVTVEVEAARQQAEYDSRMAEASRVLSYAVITGGIVHEISQPLAAIQNYAHMLKNSPEDGPAAIRRMVAEHLGEEAERAAEVIANVRRMGPQETRFDGSCGLAEAVEQSVRLVSLGSNPPPAITVKYDADEKLQIKGSLPLIGQVIINLLRNALQASASAGSAGAEIILRGKDGQAEIAVADFGAGVAPEAAEGLFVPFSKSTRGGMGLGLAICQRIASSLGGSVSWENREAGGALFKFNVPLAGEG